MIKTDKNLNIPVDFQQICTKLSEQGSFFRGGQSESKKSFSMIKTEQKIHFYLINSTSISKERIQIHVCVRIHQPLKWFVYFLHVPGQPETMTKLEKLDDSVHRI